MITSAAPPVVDTITLRVRTPTYELSASGLQVAGYALNDVPGAPRLPFYGALVELPPSGAWDVSFKSVGGRSIATHITLPAVPVPSPLTQYPGNRTSPDDLPTFVPTANRPDPAIYRQNGFYPASPVVTGKEQWQRGQRLLALRVFPFQYNPVARQLRYHPDLLITIKVEKPKGAVAVTAAVEPPATLAPSASLIASGDAGLLRIQTIARGMHRLTRDDLVSAGMPPDADPRSFVMTYQGQTMAIQVLGEEDGSFDEDDLVIFYAEPYVGRYMTHNVSWLSYGPTPAPPAARMATRTAPPSDSEPVLTTITQTLHIENDKVYPDLPTFPIPTDADHWFDNYIYAGGATPTATVTYTLALDDALATGELRLRGLLYGGKDQGVDPDQSVEVRLNTHSLGTFQWKGKTPYTVTATLPASYLDGAPNGIGLEVALWQLPNVSDYWVYPDWVELSYPALAEAEDDRLYVEGLDTGGSTAIKLSATGFTTETVRAYDVRDLWQPAQLLATEAISTGVSYTLNVRDVWGGADPPPSYWLTTQKALRQPIAIEKDANVSHWRSPQPHADYIAIYHSSLWGDSLQLLLQHRIDQGLAVVAVEVQDIYDEFSFGLVYPPAIRDFLGYAYHNWQGDPPKYVLLVGDGHYDFKDITHASSNGRPNLIPPYLALVDPWWGETAADNRYVCVDGDDNLPDMAIGRIPANSLADVTAVVDKILAYEDPAQAPDGSWQNRAVFIAGNNSDPSGNFHALSDEVRLNYLPSAIEGRHGYYNLDYYSGPAFRAGVKSEFDNSALFLQWFGHAARFFWGASGQAAWIVNWYGINDPGTLEPNKRIPFTAAYSCWSGYFINLQNYWQSLGERMLLEPGRSSVADFSPTGLHLGEALVTLDKGIVTAIFRDHIRPVGDAVNAAKFYYAANGASLDVLDTMVLLGDPATLLRVPVTLPTPPTIGIEADANTAVLGWQHELDSQRYEIWRDTSPYFDPAAGQGVPVGTEDAGLRGAGSVLSFIDDGQTPPLPGPVVGDPATNYFWVVRSRNEDGVSVVSNRVGAFDFALVPGE